MEHKKKGDDTMSVGYSEGKYPCKTFQQLSKRERVVLAFSACSALALGVDRELFWTRKASRNVSRKVYPLHDPFLWVPIVFKNPS